VADKTPKSSKVWSVIPLGGWQLICCAAVAGLALHTSAGLVEKADPADVAIKAFEARQAGDSALKVAGESLSDAIEVIVKRNDTLDQIFRRLQLSLSDLADIRAIEAARLALDRIRPGDPLTFFKREGQLVGLQRPLPIGSSSTTSQTLKIERDPSDNFTASVEEVPLARNVVTAKGTIDSSLFAAGSAAGLRDATVMELAEVFRWDVDFVLDVSAGDSFTLVYEQLAKEGQVVRDGKILAAEFVNDGKTYRAVRFVNAAGEADYYTPDGASLRKAFLKAPVQFSRISSVFNPRRKHPVLNTIRAHRGVDYAAPSGTPVLASGAGRVQYRGQKGGFGNVIEIAHSGGVVTRYGHLSSFAKGLAVGQKVNQGELIGRVGKTGLATGPHLHFEYIERGVYIDPQMAMRRASPGTPVPPAERASFNQVAATMTARLEAGPAPALAGLRPVSAR
jgi:murein DD-endopeptidase MepM/ murein hydrolase activator NlpD